MHTLATLYALKAHLGIAQSDTVHDGRLLQALIASTKTLERTCNRAFLPYRATIAHPLPRDRRTLSLLEDLLSLEGATHGDDITIAPENLRRGRDGTLVLANGEAFMAHLLHQEAIWITGVWGWHDDTDTAWQSTGDTLLATLGTESLSASINDADAPNDQTTPRFQVGQLLRLQNEFVQVIGVNTTTNVLTLSRGARGTEATAHDAGTPILCYAPPNDLVQACLMWATWQFKEPDAPQDPLPVALLTLTHRFKKVLV